VIVAVAAAVALATPSRATLIDRWLHANPAHSRARLELVPPSASPAHAVPPNLSVLAQRELGRARRYQLAESSAPPAAQSWWEQLLDWLGDRWNRFWQALFARAHVGKEQAAGLSDLLLVVVGLVFIFVALRLMSNLQVERSAPRFGGEPLGEPPNPRSLYKRACSAASRGDYGGAVLLLFAATVALLDRRGAVESTGSATVGDLRRELRSHDAALIGPFDAVAGPFVERAYAERAIGEPQWNRARDAFALLLQDGAPP
jgi:hypothetical protein